MRKAKFLILLAGFAGLAGGCAQTISAEKFLYLYRRSASPGHMDEGGFSRYAGKDTQYHYLNVQTSTLGHGAEQVLMYGAYRDETFRCLLGSLPHNFPDGFHQIFEDGKRSESDDDTYRYIREYLGTDASPAPPPPPADGAPAFPGVPATR
jgi:hypothetical protein